MAVIDQLIELFARSIFAKTRALKAYGPDLSKNQRKRLYDSIVADIRNCGGLLFPDVRPVEVSKAAQQKADGLRPPVRLCDETWHTQPRFDPGRKIFHWEHVTTISSIRKMCEEAESEEKIRNILRTRFRIAWILKREDQELKDRGYQSERPDDAYHRAKIELLPSQDRGAGIRE